MKEVSLLLLVQMEIDNVTGGWPILEIFHLFFILFP